MRFLEQLISRTKSGAFWLPESEDRSRADIDQILSVLTPPQLVEKQSSNILQFYGLQQDEVNQDHERLSSLK